MKNKAKVFIIQVFTLCLLLAFNMIVIGVTVSARVEPPSLPESTAVIFPDEAPLRYGFTDDDVYLIAQLLCGSEDYHGDGEYDFVWSIENAKEVKYDQITLVLNVVMNRVRSDQFPDTVYDVIMQKGQFSVMPKNADKTPSPIAVKIVSEWCKQYDNWSLELDYLPEDHLYFKSAGDLMNVSSNTWR